MNKIISIISLIGTVIGCFYVSENVFASDNKADFTVNAEQSTYQVDKQKTYFDLSLPTNKSVPLTIHVTNNSNESLDIEGEISAATTNLNGVVEYSQTDNQLTGKQPFDITEVATLETKTQTIAPQQTVDFIVNVNVPTDNYAGVVAGGITLRDVTEKKEDDKSNEMFQNKFAYSIALILHGKKAGEKTELSLNNVSPNQVNSRNVLSAAIYNDSANYVNKVSIDAKVIDSEKKEVLSETKENMQIAPNSIFQFPLYYEKEKVEAGTYILEMVVRSNDSEWNLSKEFTIHKEKATELNKTDVNQIANEESNGITYLLIGMMCLIVGLIILVVILWKKRK